MIAIVAFFIMLVLIFVFRALSWVRKKIRQNTVKATLVSFKNVTIEGRTTKAPVFEYEYESGKKKTTITDDLQKYADMKEGDTEDFYLDAETGLRAVNLFATIVTLLIQLQVGMAIVGFGVIGIAAIVVYFRA